MENVIPAHRIFPLGDNAVTIDFGNVIDEDINRRVIQLFRELTATPVTGMIEAIPAYSSLTVYYDVFRVSKQLANNRSAFEFISSELTERVKQQKIGTAEQPRL